MTGMEIPLLIAGTAVSFIGSMRQASAANQQASMEANAERAAAERNAQIAERNAEIIRNNSNVDAARVERETRIRQGAARAAGGGNGLELMGSALDIMEDNFMEGELDRLMILHEGEIAAENYLSDAEFARYGGETRAQAATYRGKTEASAARMGAVGSLLRGGSKIAGKMPSGGQVVGDLGGPFGTGNHPGETPK
jgi:hypothetical protein